MTKLFIILLAGLICEAVGVMCLKEGMKAVGDMHQVSATEILRVVKTAASIGPIWLGLFFETLFFISLLLLMSKSDISFLWPMTALSFVFTTIAARIYLHEYVSSTRWAGVVLIVIGAALITWSQKENKQRSLAPVSAASRTSTQLSL